MKWSEAISRSRAPRLALACRNDGTNPIWLCSDEVSSSRPQASISPRQSAESSAGSQPPEEYCEADGDFAVEWMKTNSAGSGPYVIEEFTFGQRYVLTRNENYWGDLPFYERVEIRIIPEAATQVDVLRSNAERIGGPQGQVHRAAEMFIQLVGTEHLRASEDVESDHVQLARLQIRSALIDFFACKAKPRFAAGFDHGTRTKVRS